MPAAKVLLPDYLKPARKVFKFPKFKKASEALAEALKIISTEGRWVQSNLAATLPDDEERANDAGLDVGELKPLKTLSAKEVKDLLFSSEMECDTKSKDAMAFCALGAVQFVNGRAQKSAEGFLREAAVRLRAILAGEKALEEDIMRADDEDIFHINDELGLKETKRMFRMAIKAAQKAGK
jgi:hypothetical protein